MIDSTNPRVMADNIRKLSDKQIAEAAEIVALQGDIEALGSYSTTEVDTGKKWIDGSAIYRKVFVIENLPNSTTDTVAHNISNIGVVTALYGVAQYATGHWGLTIPYSTVILLRYNATNLAITTTSDYTYASAIIVLEYTKSAAPTPNVLPSPDPDTRTLEEPEPEPEPIEEKK